MECSIYIRNPYTGQLSIQTSRAGHGMTATNFTSDRMYILDPQLSSVKGSYGSKATQRDCTAP